MKHHAHQEKAPEVKLSHEEVAKKAYTIYLNDGRQHGHDVQNWLRAESEERTLLSKNGKQELLINGNHNEKRF